MRKAKEQTISTEEYQRRIAEADELFRRKTTTEVLRKHWIESAVVLDEVGSGEVHNLPSAIIVPDIELWEGELRAMSFRIGVFAVRISRRVYHRYDPGFHPEEERSATREEMQVLLTDCQKEYQEGIREEMQEELDLQELETYLFRHRDKYCIATEVTAKVARETGKYRYICRAIEAEHLSWYEGIREIAIAKKHPSQSDRHERLFVCHTFYGNSHTDDTWYRMEVSGKIKKFQCNSMPF